MTDNPSFPYQLVLLDIEGTTTSISFVSDVLFPFIRKNVERYLRENWNEKETQMDLEQLHLLSKEDVSSNQFENFVAFDGFVLGNELNEKVLDSAVQNVFWQMNRDRKSTALKRLQGHMWRSGYESGELTSHVYDDVIPAFDKWKERGIPIFIYSSGSIEAQKLLFQFTPKGNLLPYIMGHYDTTSGLKVEKQSYDNIFESIRKIEGVNIGEKKDILFVTDNVLEAKAADEAGYQVAVTKRPGNAPLPEDLKFKVVESFDQLQ